MNNNLILILSAMFLALSVQSWASELRIIDADTIVLNGAKVRLNGIDAPEMRQNCEDINLKMYACGVSSKRALQNFIQTRPDEMVQCQYIGKDAYGRMIGDCSIGKININMWLVENGWALAYRKYSKKYVENENSAKNNLVGIWSGKFVEPWKWRRGERLPSETIQSKNGCLIKGNISSSGDRIYHVQEGQYYNETKISIEKGERWFCSEVEAEENGWRKSKR